MLGLGQLWRGSWSVSTWCLTRASIRAEACSVHYSSFSDQTPESTEGRKDLFELMVSDKSWGVDHDANRGAEKAPQTVATQKHRE